MSLTVKDPKEIPTKNIGMVISPSIRALSDILTNKVTSQSKSTSTISEENEDEVYSNDDNSTILLRSLHRQPSSLIDDIYSPENKYPSTFKKMNSNDTLTINVLNNPDPNNQPDLIDLNTPVVENTKFTSNSQVTLKPPSLDDPNQTNYSDLFEAYSPVKGDSSYNSSTMENDNVNTNSNNDINNTKENELKQDTEKETNIQPTNDKRFSNRFSNRFSMISDNFDNFLPQL